MSKLRSLTALSVSSLAVIALAACGDDDSSSPSLSAGTGGGESAIEVIAEDIAFGEDRYTAAAGEVELTYVNEGAIPHTLLIEGVDGFKLEVQSNGDVDEGTVELEPGTYTIWCDIAGHREAGMEATLVVE
ncbi:MAG TPA: cupredoxin domain-containing protein [Acidimicrobiales bacterium]|nr:cupredoxin domain-containing protein [Acidimicrobiales bacterium]